MFEHSRKATKGVDWHIACFAVDQHSVNRLEHVMAPANATPLTSALLRFFELCYGHMIAAEYDQQNPKRDEAPDSYLAIWSTSGEYHGKLHDNVPRE
ncbi:MAG: hypothetical protein EON84_22775 [Bradyrhizobiaceae bacterium]|nr:MAG: hypothetical protein EON84_22775 [Bradyrhizobiaceae bacterium]